MQAFMEALAEALRRHGHTASRDSALEGLSGAVYTIPLLVEADGQAFVIDAHLDGVAPAEAMHDLATVWKDVGADGAVLCHLEAAETHDTGVHLWGRDDLVRILGGAALEAATGLQPHDVRFTSPGGREAPVAQSISDLMPPAFAEPGPDLEALEGLDLQGSGADAEVDPPFATDEVDEEPLLGDMFDMLAGNAAIAEGMAAPSEGAVETEPTAPASVQAVEERPRPAAYAHPLLPVVVTREDAMAMARERLFETFAVEAVLQPVHLLDYECDLLAEGSLRYDTIQGRIQVHGTDKTVIEVDREAVDPAGFTKVTDVIADHERALRTSETRARERATGFLMETHTRVVDVQVASDEGSFDYTEKKKVSPRPDHVRLHHLGTFFRVLWRVRGPNGHVDVDALTGEAVEERLQTPDPDTLILD